MGSDPDSVLELQAETPALSAPWKMFQNLRANRQLLRHFISRDMKMRYHGSILGYGWTIAEPLALTVTFYILFAILSDSVDPHRPLNILLGILGWAYFAKTTTRCTVSLQRNSALIKRVYFPREIFLFSQVGFNALNLLLSLLVIIPLLYHYGMTPTLNILLFPVAMILIAMLALGLSFFTCIIQTKMRDIEHIVTVALRIGFYLSPVFYTLDMITKSRIPAEYADIYLFLNPMATYLTMIRCAFTGQPLDIDSLNLIVTISSTVLLYLLGSMYFMRSERKAVKYL
jgi:ABC-type polysaccharide/polyol phosphate export permease